MSWTAPDDSFFWPLLQNYRSPTGQTIVESEIASMKSWGFSEERIAEDMSTNRWMSSPKPQRDTIGMLSLLAGLVPVESEVGYLEFGTCFGTTFSSVMSLYPNGHGTGLEKDPGRYQISKYVIESVGREMGFLDRINLHNASISEFELKPNSLDIVFMDTDHKYPNDYNYIHRLLDSGALRDGFVFVGDDPFHSGTDTSRLRFIDESSDEFEIQTDEALDLFWFRTR